jgi:hypothetical protein
MLVTAAVCDGKAVAGELDRCFADASVRYVHLHSARAGRYSCVANRV